MLGAMLAHCCDQCQTAEEVVKQRDANDLIADYHKHCRCSCRQSLVDHQCVSEIVMSDLDEYHQSYQYFLGPTLDS